MDKLICQIEGITNDFEHGVSSKQETNTAILSLFINVAIDARRYQNLKQMRLLHEIDDLDKFIDEAMEF